MGQDKTAFVLALGTISDKGTIDDIGRALKYPLSEVKIIKQEYDTNPKKCREKYSELFYYFDGLVNTIISQSQHPAGIIASPITLMDNYGIFYGAGGQTIIQLDMEAVHNVGLVKYDILGLRNIGVIKQTYAFLGKLYPQSYEINWNDEKVWEDMKKNNIGIFQFESDFAYKILKDFDTKSIEDMSLVTAMIRPSGSSYRDRLSRHIINHNPSEIIDKLLKDNLGYLVYQEDVIAFLQNICGLSGGDADEVRRAIGRKDEEALKNALPSILEGYCGKSDKERVIAEEEAKIFLKIIEDASSYMFGKNHSFGYCLIGYLCAYLRHYYPLEFLTAFFNCSEFEEDFVNGTELAKYLNVEIKEPRFRHSKSEYFFDREKRCVYKGISSIKYLNGTVGEQLYELRNNSYTSFIKLLSDISEKTSLNSNQLDILIKLDFFKEFGNSKLLTKLNNMFIFFKNGKAKSIKKNKLTEKVIYDIVSRYSKESNTQFSNINTEKIMLEIEELISCQNIEDYDFKFKIEKQLQYLGYIGLCTGQKEDRPKIVINEIKNCISKFGKDVGTPWAVLISGQSIGSGKKSTYTIPYKVFSKNKFMINDVINIKDVKKNDKGYWYIYNYEKL